MAVVGLLLLLGTPAAARPAPPAPPPAPAAAMLAALERDLGLPVGTAAARLAADEAARDTADDLRGRLGDRFGGAWLDGGLVVASTDAADTGLIEAAGARARIVRYSQRALDVAKTDLDARPADPALVSWHVDLPTNTVLVRASTAAVAAWAKADGPYRVEISDARPTPTVDVRGGQRYSFGRNACSFAFPVVGGLVTAGHCGTAGTAVSVVDPASDALVEVGAVAASVFPGSDMAWVRTNANATVLPWVLDATGNAPVNGAREALVNAAVCRSGGTSGWHCGTIEARNVTVNYTAGPVTGLTRTDVCGEPGDSGGAYLSGGQAQGVASGARLSTSWCPSGPDAESYFQPVQPVLARWGLTLVTSPGAITGLTCSPLRVTFRCTVAVQPGIAARIRWVDEGVSRPAWDDLTSVKGGCLRNQVRSVHVTVTTAEGSDTRMDTFHCEGNQ